MVELVGVMSGVDEWPSDMDARVAALDFADSIISIDGVSCSSFEPSVSTYDPSLSTDSLDSEQLRQRCEHKTDDYKLTFADSGQWTTSTHLTTWGRIQYNKPLDDKIVSAPDVTVPSSSPSFPHRPSSLLIDFVGRHSADINRYVDVNENDIEERRNSQSTKNERWKCPNRMKTSSHRMKRTFADLEEAPELNFLQLPHQTRALTESTSLPEALAELGDTASLGLDSLLLQQSSPPDSGLGCSGPLHIEDWPSLSVLLPKHVAEACAFFRKNSDLLGTSNCVERSSRSHNEPCTTCFRVRRKGLLHPPGWALSSHSRITLCDCTKSEFTPRPIGRSATFSTNSGLASRELAIVGLPVYSEARRLVETIVEGVAISIRGDGEDILSDGIVALLSHGLKEGYHPWEVITAVTAPGPATAKIHSLVSDLSSSDRSSDASLHVFIHALIIDCSLECWLSYVLLKEKTLSPFYRPSSFLLSSPSAYRSLLNRLLQSLQLLSIHDSTEPRLSFSRASRIPSDSRVPKSSSVPARLSPSISQSSFRHNRRPSRIPQPRTRLNTPSSSRTSLLSSLALSPIEARVKETSAEPGQLDVSEGERVRVLSTRGSYAHCYRLRRNRRSVLNGIIPLTNLSLN
ncbi:unc-14 [Pristionchus pacificus]|uniref:Unc-14 n=1 Tax=Pristionchus pacificus TaxID=54126 RepID=A0A2A6CC51_PRIPA|nr:unc-14 [Pristionchus pacificus]|eukprot:PDM75680.1 unc-14 [Pristionchus pacificus]